MAPKYELTDNPPPDAFQKMWTPLLKFNEHAVGNANACTLAICVELGLVHRSCDKPNKKRSDVGAGICGRKLMLSKHVRFTKSSALASSVVWTVLRRSSLASSSQRISTPRLRPLLPYRDSGLVQ